MACGSSSLESAGTDHKSGATSARACVVSIEVDGRQGYIFETDKLQEMLGASRLVLASAAEADELFKEPLCLFQPVSGDIRVWALRRDLPGLVEQTWKLRRWLTARGIEHRVSYCEVDPACFTELSDDPDRSLATVREKLGASAARNRLIASHADARPRCSLFAACQIHPWDAANYWRLPDVEVAEPRRQLVGYRAAAKRFQWRAAKGRFYQEYLTGPIRIRLTQFNCDLPATRPILFEDLSDRGDHAEDGDRFIAFLCADGDGLGRALASVKWNQGDWPHCSRDPWKRGVAVADAISKCTSSALARALAEVLIPDARAAAAITQQVAAEQVWHLPILPLLVGGDDVWAISGRREALPLAAAFARLFAEKTGDSPVLADAFGGTPAALTLSVGVAFAKAGYPASSMVDAAEDLLALAKGRRHDLIGNTGLAGYVDWFWIASGVSDRIHDSRSSGFSYRDVEGNVLTLSSLPWTADQTAAMISVARTFNGLSDPDPKSCVSRRKREQLDSVLRRGLVLSGFAWEAWWQSLTDDERSVVRAAAQKLHDVGLAPAPPVDDSKWPEPWRNDGKSAYSTSWLDLVGLYDVLRG